MPKIKKFLQFDLSKLQSIIESCGGGHSSCGGGNNTIENSTDEYGEEWDDEEYYDEEVELDDIPKQLIADFRKQKELERESQKKSPIVINPRSKRKIRICDNCDSTILSGAKFCSGCGSKV